MPEQSVQLCEERIMRKLLKALKHDERGVSALEYAILAGIIVVAVAGAMVTFGGKIENLFERTGTELDKVAAEEAPQ